SNSYFCVWLKSTFIVQAPVTFAVVCLISELRKLIQDGGLTSRSRIFDNEKHLPRRRVSVLSSNGRRSCWELYEFCDVYAGLGLPRQVERVRGPAAKNKAVYVAVD